MCIRDRLGAWVTFNVGSRNKINGTESERLTSNSDSMANEANIQIDGYDSRTIKKIVVEAEIRRNEDKATTISNAIECLKLINAPKNVIDSYRREEPYSKGNWTVAIAPYPSGTGYDVVCTFVPAKTTSQRAVRKNARISPSKEPDGRF